MLVSLLLSPASVVAVPCWCYCHPLLVYWCCCCLPYWCCPCQCVNHLPHWSGCCPPCWCTLVCHCCPLLVLLLFPHWCVILCWCHPSVTGELLPLPCRNRTCYHPASRCSQQWSRAWVKHGVGSSNLKKRKEKILLVKERRNVQKMYLRPKR
jgi:hypothetical protein